VYAKEKRRLWQEFPLEKVAEATEEVWRAYEDGGTIFACGNGGNAAFASNLTNDFSTLPFMSDSKNVVTASSQPRLRAISLSDSSTTITALMNDLGPEYIFSEQLKLHNVGKNDVLFAFSGSGNSGNVLEAVAVARSVGATVVGLSRGDGGKLQGVVDIGIIIPGTSQFPGQVGGNNFNFHYEDALSAIAHMISGILKQRVDEKIKIAA